MVTIVKMLILRGLRMIDYKIWGPDDNFSGCDPTISINFYKEPLYDEIWGSSEPFPHMELHYDLHKKLMKDWIR